MKRSSVALVLALTLSSISSSVFAMPKIGVLDDDPVIQEADCGLFLENKSGNLVFFADTHYSGFIQVDNATLELPHVKTTNKQKKMGVVGKGDSYRSVFATEGTEATLALSVVNGCEKTGEKCEEVKVSGTVTVKAKTGSIKIPVTGIEHCALEPQ